MERMGFENLNCSSLRGKFLEKILIFKGARALSRIATEEEVCKKKAVVPMRRYERGVEKEKEWEESKLKREREIQRGIYEERL
jgi:hypothetical protein